MPTDPTILSELRRHAHSERPLLICDSERLTYAEADRRSAAFGTPDVR